ncbi:hypothetical protein [Nonomuraea gerenzanensis]|uniref:Phage terminase, large subunit \|nr:hypothetical protein [Nonomuraea gerenzanensis]UBU11613.1 hypothetical protein LCN96_46125 [Nonomuraea gerenzanensis]SBP00107.1 Phage terminase, large subunit \
MIDLAASAGLILDPWQQYVLTHGLGQGLDEQWTARKVSVWVPRQNGKGGIIEALELAWLFLFKDDLIIHSAHQHRTSSRAYARLERIIRDTPHLYRQVAQFRQANGEQQIETRDGRLLQYVTRSRTAIRGFSSAKIILDEAQELTGEQMAAVLPTVSAMPNWQVWFLGTPPDDPAAWVYGLRADGEASVPRLAHFDWGAALDITDAADRRRAARDRDLWYACNPAMGLRITEDTVEDEAKPSGLGDKFAVERLGVWLPRAADGAAVLSVDDWLELTDPESKRAGEVAFALDVTPSRDAACISAYGLREDGLGHLEVVDHRPGTDWVVDRLVTLKDRWAPVAIGLDVKGPAGSLLEPLKKAGITPPEDPEHPKRGDLAIPTVQDVAAGCGQLSDAVRQGTLRHIGQELLETAVRGVKTRPLGEAWAWGRRVSSVDISPLVSGTVARWAYETRAHVIDDDYDVEDSFG